MQWPYIHKTVHEDAGKNDVLAFIQCQSVPNLHKDPPSVFGNDDR